MSLVDRCRQRCRQSEEDEGFTLIELLVVLLIIGILLAIAIPTFLSVTKGANGTAAQSNLQTALTGADTFYTSNNQSYTNIMTSGYTGASTLTQIDTGLTYQSTASKATNQIFWDTTGSSGNAIFFAAYAPGQQTCWAVLDVKATGASVTGVTGTPSTAVGTDYGKATNITSSTGCTNTTTTYSWSTLGFSKA